MFSAKMTTRLAGIALASVAVCAPAAVLAGVIVKSSGPSAKTYPVGKKISDTATITLKAGDSVTVLTSRGTKVMKGAGTFKVGEKPKVTRARFSNLTRSRAGARNQTGAVRGTEKAVAATKASLWDVDVAQSATMCLTNLSSVRLWRAGSDGLASYSVLDTANNASVDVTFEDKEMVTALDPALLSIVDGGAYTITGPDGASATVTFKQLDQDYRRADQLAEALFDAGCTAQVAQLADELGE